MCMYSFSVCIQIYVPTHRHMQVLKTYEKGYFTHSSIYLQGSSETIDMRVSLCLCLCLCVCYYGGWKVPKSAASMLLLLRADGATLVQE